MMGHGEELLIAMNDKIDRQGSRKSNE